MNDVSKTGAALAKALMDHETLVALYTSAKMMRDAVITPALNKSIGNQEEQKRLKNLYLKLDKFVNAYENFVKEKGGSR